MLPKWWRRNFLPVECLICLGAMLAFGFWSSALDKNATLEAILQGNRGAIYGTVASISGALLGFVITALSLLMTSANSDRLAILRESRHYSTLWRTFTEAIRALGVSTATSLLALLLDRDSRAVPLLEYVVAGALLLAILRIARTVWILEKVVTLLSGKNRAQTVTKP